MNTPFTRRHFLAGAAAVTSAGILGTPQPLRAQEVEIAETPPLADTPPVLQTAAETSMGIAWGVTAAASGFVDISTEKTAFFEDAAENGAKFRRFLTGTIPLASIQPRILSAQMEGLTPATTYYYRTGTIPVTYPNAYNIKTGETVTSQVYSFTTPGANADSSFAVINDTHANAETFRALDAKLKKLGAAVTLWNGDLGEMRDAEDAVRTLLHPGNTDFAAERPVLFVPGNHDYRGAWARNMEQALIKRLPAERESKYWQLGWNFALRQGEIALVGLDTGEDKPDRHPVFAGMANFEPYRELQTRWLAEVLEKPEIASAPYIVAFCHIPLFSPNPNANPGDILEGYAYWQRPCSRMWSPLFEKHGVQLVVSAHIHRYTYDAPDENRAWAQITGGGPQLARATVIEGRVADGRLKVTVHAADGEEVLGEHTFEKRRESV